MDTMVTLLVAAVVLLVIWVRAQLGKRTEVVLPPGSMGLPFIGETLQFARKKVEYFRQKHREHGRVFKTRLFGRSIVRVYGSENIRRIIQGENKIVLSSYPASVRKLIGNQSISMSHGDVHKAKKRELMKYLSPEFFHEHTPVLAQTISDRLVEWCERPQLDLYDGCKKLFIDLAARFLINIDISDQDVICLDEQLQIFSDNIFCLPVNLPGFGFRKALQAKANMRKIISSAITRSMNNNVASDELCSVLQKIQNQSSCGPDDEPSLELVDNIIDLLFSGSQTVTSAGFSLAHILCNRPDVRQKLHEELSSQGLADTSEPVTTHHMKELHYAEAVVKETLRMLPPVGGAYRTALETFELDGYTVPKGWSIVFSIRETHMNDSAVHQPDVFNPEQWLQPDFGKDKYSFLPFGGGARVCPGQAYTKMVLRLFAIEFCRNCLPAVEKDSDLLLWPTPRPKDQVLVSVNRLLA